MTTELQMNVDNKLRFLFPVYTYATDVYIFYTRWHPVQKDMKRHSVNYSLLNFENTYVIKLQETVCTAVLSSCTFEAEFCKKNQHLNIYRVTLFLHNHSK